jgi:ubiquinol-cytochrome c reductase cytochrome b subunit
MLALVVSIGAALTGYVVQTNFDSQWIAFEAKDGLNAVGVGAWFNVANLGQNLLMHVFLMPAILLVLVVVHVVLVRLHGVVPPIDAAQVEAAGGAVHAAATTDPTTADPTTAEPTTVETTEAHS